METQKNLTSFLNQIVENSSEKTALDWLNLQAEKIHSEGSPTKFFLAFSQASRHFKKLPISLSEDQKQKASKLIAGFDPSHWDLLQTARTILLLQFPQEKTAWFKAINQLFETSDMNEHQALFAALPLMPFQEDLIPRAIDGLRMNISTIFDAIALNNPFPAKYFPENNWNQMVIKAIFLQRPLYRIQGSAERNNLALAKIASDLAHERWAAGRQVMPEQWKYVVPYMETFFADIKKTLQFDDPLQIKAALLACYESDYAPAKELLKGYPAITSEIEKGLITWEKIGREYEISKD